MNARAVEKRTHDASGLKEVRQNEAPSRIMDVLKKIESKEYREMAGLLKDVGDVTRDHGQRSDNRDSTPRH